MSEAPAVEAPTVETTEAAPTEKPAKAEPDWKAEARKWEQRAKENSKAAERLAQFEESQKTEAQKAQEAREAAERRATEAERANLRYRVGIEKKLPGSFTEVLQGDSEEDMAAHADRLLAEIAELNKSASPPSFDGGARTSAPLGSDMNQIIRRNLRGG